MELPITFCPTHIISKVYLRTRNCQKEWREAASEKGKQTSEIKQFLKCCSIDTQSFESLSTTTQNPVFEE